MFIWYHVMWPWQMNVGGIAASASHYHATRMVHYFADAMGGVRNAFTDAPDYTGGGADGAAWWDELAKQYLGMFYKQSADATFQHNGAPGNTLYQSQGSESALTLVQMNPTGDWTPALKYYVLNDWGGYSASYGYLGARPDVTAARSANTSFITTAPLAPGCAAQWNAAICGADRRFFFGSRSGTSLENAWGPGGTVIWYPWYSNQKRDHIEQLHDIGPTIAANGYLMLSGDGDRGGIYSTGGVSHGNILVLGSESNIKTNGVGISVPIYVHGSGTLAAGGVDITEHYKPAANVKLANRSIIHLKADGHGFVITRDDFAASELLTATTYNGFNVNNMCGSPSPVNPSCLKLDRNAKTVTMTKASTARLDAIFSGIVETANSTDTDGTYRGGSGYTFRVTNSVTGTSETLWGLFQSFRHRNRCHAGG